MNTNTIDVMSREQLLVTLPIAQRSDIEQDLNQAFAMFTDDEAPDSEYRVRVELMTKYSHAADNLLNRCFDLGTCGRETHEDHLLRIATIVSLLKRSPVQYPIIRFGNSDDDVIVVEPWHVSEGLHRLVAFHQLGLPSVTVIYIN